MSAAIEASSVRLKTMADGSMQITVEVEPRNAVAAFTLFSSPGTPMALAALKCAKAEPERKGGEIAKWLAIRCNEPEFCKWLMETWPLRWARYEADAAEVVRSVCAVESRADLDHDAEAAQRFHTLIRGPYSKHGA